MALLSNKRRTFYDGGSGIVLGHIWEYSYCCLHGNPKHEIRREAKQPVT
jgi:hypothetical protein